MPNSEELRQAGLKTTLPRLKILGILEDAADQHFTAEDVYKRLLDSGEEIGLATVYRVLTQFEGAQLVIRHNFEGGRSVFELNDGKHHDHMVCVKCSKVIEFYNQQIENLQTEVAEDHSFTLQEHALVMYGLCSDCVA
ncbi:MAG: ferric iron uptake transcriptional regulator [Proteobacteria bacterium]|jgi:Fur family transcriptional regulator, ferric uptake regulator|nr:ferric iron uptake transcriptional regulator [Pseudomonadota bacterium]